MTLKDMLAAAERRREGPPVRSLGPLDDMFDDDFITEQAPPRPVRSLGPLDDMFDEPPLTPLRRTR